MAESTVLRWEGCAPMAIDFLPPLDLTATLTLLGARTPQATSLGLNTEWQATSAACIRVASQMIIDDAEICAELRRWCRETSKVITASVFDSAQQPSEKLVGNNV